MKPITFSSDMVRAIIDGRKCITRRVIKPHNSHVAHSRGYKQGDGLWITDTSVKDYSIGSCWERRERYVETFAPNKPGDLLWVRETWRNHCNFDDEYCYYADDHVCKYDGCKWRPSIHMPRAAARIFLRVTDVRVERLQDITPQNAKAEGVSIANWLMRGAYDGDASWYYCEAFGAQWDSLNAKRGYGWEENPWVWVYTFETAR